MSKTSILLNRLMIFSFFVCILIISWFLLFYIFNKKNDLAEFQIKLLIPLIENYKVKNNNYPLSINEISQYKQITDKKVLLFFSAPKINYHIASNGYRFEFYGAPLGPHYGYDSITKEWYSEE